LKHDIRQPSVIPPDQYLAGQDYDRAARVVRERNRVSVLVALDAESAMTSVLRWTVVAVLAGHGLIHLLGVVKGFGWAEVTQLKQPIGPGVGGVWLLAATLVLATAVLIAAQAPSWWWLVAVIGAVASEVAIATAWSDAKFGTAGNLILLLAAVYGFASLGPTSLHAQFRERSSANAESKQ
jgi:hypothetical protein